MKKQTRGESPLSETACSPSSFLTDVKDPSVFAPCSATPVIFEKRIAQHPAVVVIRNKRHRARTIKKYRRMGIESYCVAGWQIFTENKEL
jgi:hypothetical protein